MILILKLDTTFNCSNSLQKKLQILTNAILIQSALRRRQVVLFAIPIKSLMQSALELYMFLSLKELLFLGNLSMDVFKMEK